MNKNYNLSDVSISKDLTHHIYKLKPLYNNRYSWVGKFHNPGLAPASRNSKYFHIDINGLPAYTERFDKVFGFYCDIATVIIKNKWLHINNFGEKIHKKNFDWSGNFQENICVVKLNKKFFHIKSTGDKIYNETYDYVGDFRDGIAVVYLNNKATHIDKKGHFIHNEWFKQLGVFHKGFATALDKDGWFHIDQNGDAIYQERFKSVEPFYNDLSKAETLDGKIMQIDTNGTPFSLISDASEEIHKSNISDDLVGFWKTQILYSAAYMNVLNKLPNTAEKLSILLKIPKSNLLRFLRALQELSIINQEDKKFLLTNKGYVLKKFSYLQDAAIMWGNVSHQDWRDLPKLLSQKEIFSHLSFKDIEPDKKLKKHYHSALTGYLSEDTDSIVKLLDNSQDNIACIGQSSQILIKALNNKLPKLNISDNFNTTFDINLCVFLKHLLHFDDNKVKDYFKKIKNLKIKSIVIIETLLFDHDPRGGMLDLNMLIESGGKLRTSNEYKQLLKEHSFSIRVIKSINPYLQIIFAEQL